MQNDQTKQGHTPGPWSINGPYHIQADTEPSALPKVLAHIIQGYGVSLEEKIANARLIAAAPELLEALRELVIELLDTTVNDRGELVINDQGTFNLYVTQARAAIAKARG